MPGFGDAFLQTANVLGQKRDQMINQAVASETSKTFNAFQEKADLFLAEQDLNDPDPFTFFDRNKEQYENIVSDFMDSIPDKEVRQKFTGLVNNHRTSFSETAFKMQTSKLKRNQQETFQDDSASESAILASLPSDEIDMHFEGLTLQKMKMNVDSAFPELKDAIRKGYAPTVRTYLDSKINRADELLAENKIDFQDYKTEIDILQQKLNSTPEMFQALGADTTRAYNNAISNMKQTGLEKAQARRRARLTADLPGYELSVKQGEGLDLNYHNEMRMAFAGTPQEATVDKNLRILEETADIYESRRLGEYQTTVDISKESRLAFENSKATGIEREIQAAKAIAAQQVVQQSGKILSVNPYQYLKDSPEIKLAEFSASQTGDLTQLVQTVANKTKSLGISESRVTFLKNEALQQMTIDFDNADTETLKGIGRALKQKYNIQFGDNGNAYKNIVNQMVEHFSGEEKHGDKAIAFHYVNTPAFNSIMEATDLKLNKAEVENLLPAGVKLDDVRKQVQVDLEDFTNSVIAQEPSPKIAQQIKNSYIELGIKMAINKLLDPNTSLTKVGNLDQASNMVKKELVDSLFLRVKSEDGIFGSPLVNLRLPKEAQGLNLDHLQRIIKTPDFRDHFIKYATQGLGVKSLEDNVTSLLDGAKDRGAGLFKEEIKLKNIIGNSALVTSADERGVMIIVKYQNQVLPLLDNDGKELVVPFSKIQEDAMLDIGLLSGSGNTRTVTFRRF